MFDNNFLYVMIIFLFAIVALGMFQARKMKKYISYSYTSSTNQAYDGIVKVDGNIIVFDGKKYYLLPQYGVNKQYTKGLSGLFPTKITHYDLLWNSPYPIDHKTGQPAILSPEVERSLDQQSSILATYQNQGQSAISGIKTKGGIMEKLMPILTIVAILGVAYLVWTNMSAAKNDKVTQQAIIDIYNTFNQNGIKIIPSK